MCMLYTTPSIQPCTVTSSNSFQWTAVGSSCRSQESGQAGSAGCMAMCIKFLIIGFTSTVSPMPPLYQRTYYTANLFSPYTLKWTSTHSDMFLGSQCHLQYSPKQIVKKKKKSISKPPSLFSSFYVLRQDFWSQPTTQFLYQAIPLGYQRHLSQVSSGSLPGSLLIDRLP